ncbi:glycosyltransferase family 4 protein [Flavobacterium aquidurense]|uniref:glycosyltransferase family 4 protein n=1 Tax=Flavobacterium aquidurense TaxID=362413 RepID=UPI002862CA19|nr:glycosyltransferase family 4 protein [Flavobacterium aquidurense]MDR7372308.1 glycosyltransferase involved in cell wall biosynthesis [Flavobacterium aquidurense]
MRIVQIIDSLEAGGAERMAVNYANALVGTIEFSGLIATRKEGILLNHVDEKAGYLYLNKKNKIDFKAILKLRKYIKANKIDVIHAHSSSFFIAVLVKLTLSKIKIIWHDHYGVSQDLISRKNLTLKYSSFFFIGIIAVNSALKSWAESFLWCSNISYFPNFVDEEINSSEKIFLKGLEGKRIVCVANLRPQKNHELLIKAANSIRNKFPDWSFHLLGKDFNDVYSDTLRKKVEDLKLQNVVYFYGTTSNVSSALEQCDIGVLPSLSEGLPLALLEYGLHKLPVVVTNVGEISKIITSEKVGLIVDSDDLNQFEKSIQRLIENENYRIEMGLKLHEKIALNYSQEAIIDKYVLWLSSLINFVPKK